MLKENKPDFLDIAVEKTEQPKKVRKARVKKIEQPVLEEKVEQPKKKEAPLPEYDLYKIYQEHFERQQTQVLAFWTQVLNNMFWWTKK